MIAKLISIYAKYISIFFYLQKRGSLQGEPK
jgi:hypothetical protein